MMSTSQGNTPVLVSGSEGTVRRSAPFNVYNLDPFVWFVHVRLGFSGYGFSVDDDTADVGAGGATHLQLTVTGTGGLKNTNVWTIQAPYGPVKNVSLQYSGPANATNGDTLYNAIASVSNTTPIRITTPCQHNLSEGDYRGASTRSQAPPEPTPTALSRSATSRG